MYFDHRTYFQVVKSVFTDTFRVKRLATHIFILVLLSGWALLNSVSLWLDNLVFPRFRQRQISRPVFIVGNARSGTTFFHRILCGDTEHFAHFRLWEILLPSLIQKKSIHAIGQLSVRMGGGLQRLIHGWEDRKFSDMRKMHPLGLSAPEEDEFLMLIPFASSVLNVLFPYPERLHYLANFDGMPEAEQNKMMEYYRECVQRQLYLYGPRQTLLSKNPAFVSKLRALRRTFPDARFIYLIRNPFETIPSLLKMLREVWVQLGIDEERIRIAQRGIGEGCIEQYLYAAEVLAELPESSYAMVRYEDLLTSPKGTVEGVYAQLGLPISVDFAHQLQVEQSQAQGYRSQHRYSLEEVGFTREEIATRLQPILERFGWGNS